MGRRSRYRERATHPLSKAQAAFEDWLEGRDYETADEDAPLAVPALALVDDFLDDCPEFEKAVKVVRRHAQAIGFVSDYDIDADEDLYEEDE